MRRTNKYTDSPPPLASAHTTGSALQVEVALPSGRSRRLDFSFFVVDGRGRHGLARAFADVLRADSNLAAMSQQGLHQSARTFNRFLDWRRCAGTSAVPRDVLAPADFTEDLLYEYQAWLRAQPWRPISMCSAYRNFIALLGRLRAHDPSILPTDCFLPSWPRGRVERCRNDVLGIDMLRAIFKAALSELEHIRAGHGRALAMLEATKDLPFSAKMRRGFWRVPEFALHALVRKFGLHRRLPRGLTSRFWSLARHRPLEFPSPRALLGTYVPLGNEPLIPALVVLHLRTGMNLSSALTLGRDCLHPHLHPDLAILEYDKPRSGVARAKSMVVPQRQANGVVDLLEFVKLWTKPLAELAPAGLSNRLFLVLNDRLYNHYPSLVTSACEKALLESLHRFQARHSLPHFSFSDLRPSIATYLYLETRDVFRVQHFLGHQSVKMTLSYIRGRVVRDRHNEAVAVGIGELLNRLATTEGNKLPMRAHVVRDDNPAASLAPEDVLALRRHGAVTLVGRCRDPLDSPQPGERRGRACRSLHACLFCPGAWIFEEDLVRVLRFRDLLARERSLVSEMAWRAMYLETWEALAGVIGSFSKQSICRAEAELAQVAS